MHCFSKLSGFISGFLVLICSVSGLNGQKVSTREERAADLTLAASFFDRENPQLMAAIGEMPNPFVRQSALAAAKRLEEAAAAAARRPLTPSASETTDSAEVLISDPAGLAEADALKEISEKFLPSGALRMGDQRFLLVPNASGPTSRLAVGSAFEAAVGGQTYRVVIEEVDERGYTLRLGQARISRQYWQNRVEGIQQKGP